jgi:hypothetical protein
LGILCSEEPAEEERREWGEEGSGGKGKELCDPGLGEELPILNIVTQLTNRQQALQHLCRAQS